MPPPTAQHSTICGTAAIARSKREKSSLRWFSISISTKTMVIGPKAFSEICAP